MARPRKELDREKAIELAKKGATNAEMAKGCDMSLRVFQQRLSEDADLAEAIQQAKCDHDVEVEVSLAKKAKGFTGPDGKYYPPDTVACIFWLKNRQPDRWKDKQDVNHGGSVTVEIVKFENPPA